MNTILISNASSNVQNTLTAGDTDSLAYSTPASFPNLAKQVTEVSPFISYGSGTPHSNSETFNVPQSLNWYAGRLKFLITGAINANDLTKYVGFNIINTIQLVCNGQPFGTLSGEAIKALVSNNNFSFQTFSQRYALPLDPTTELVATAGVGPYLTYVPLIFSWFGTPERSLDLSQLSQIQVVVTYKSFGESGLTNAITSMQTKLQTWKFRPDAMAYNKMVSLNKQYGLNQEAMNTFLERKVCTGAGNAITNPQVFVSDSYYPDYKTHFFIAKTNITGNDAALAVGCPQIPITSISIGIGGEMYYSNLSNSTVEYEQCFNGNTNFLATNATSVSMSTNMSVLTIDWSLLCGRDKSTGLASFANMAKPEFTIYLGAKDAVTVALPLGQVFSDYFIMVVHEYTNILNIDVESRVIAIKSAH